MFPPSVASRVLCAAALAAGAHLARASESATATVAAPAVVTAAADHARQGGSYVVIDVTGFTPPKRGGVEAVVRLENGTALGRFGMFPNAAFVAGGDVAPRRFAFRLPPGAAPGPVTLRVELAPVNGDGEGASLQLGRARIETRG